MIDYAPKLAAPLIAPMTEDGPAAREILDFQLLLMPRSERPRPLVNRDGLVTARYHDWYSSKRRGG
jgi:hypothetical protein